MIALMVIASHPWEVSLMRRPPSKWRHFIFFDGAWGWWMALWLPEGRDGGRVVPHKYCNQ